MRFPCGVLAAVENARCRGLVLNWRSVLQALLLLSIVSTTACGFSPRGSIAGSGDVGAIYVDAQRDVPIAILLKKKILDQDFKLAANRDEASILVRLTNEQQGQRVLSVQSEGKVSEFELRHATDMLVVKVEAGKPAEYEAGAKANRVSVVREYTYDDTGVLGKEDEASILRREMRDELARNLLLRIIAGVQ